MRQVLKASLKDVFRTCDDEEKYRVEVAFPRLLLASAAGVLAVGADVVDHEGHDLRRGQGQEVGDDLESGAEKESGAECVENGWEERQRLALTERLHGGEKERNENVLQGLANL